MSVQSVEVTAGPAELALSVGETIVVTPSPPLTVEVGAVVGAQGPPGPTGGAPYEHVQTTPAATWTITHGRGHYPIAAVLDSTGAALLPDLTHPDVNTAVIVHAAPTAGRAVFI